MTTDQETLRRVLNTSPGLLAYALGDPTIIARLRNPEAFPPALTMIDECPREPIFDVFDEGNEIVVVAELPGVDAKQLRVYGYPAMVVIHVRGRGSRYPVQLPRQIEPAALSYTFCNGVFAARARCSGAGGTR